MEKRSRRRIRDLVARPASLGLSENEIGCARISMMARDTNVPFKGRIQKRKTYHLQIITFRLQRAAGPYRSCHEPSFSPNGRLWNVRLHQSALAPENLITLAHFSVSSAMNLPKSEDEPGNTAAPRSANRAFNLGSARPALISLLSLSTISAGVSLGAPMPCSALAS